MDTASCLSVHFIHIIQIISSHLLSKTLKILPIVLYGYETWSLTWKEERILQVFENKTLRKTFGPKKDEISAEFRSLHKEELCELYKPPSIVRIVKYRRL